MGYQFFLPMVLRWRASRAEAPLLKLVPSGKPFRFGGMEKLVKTFY